jgi:hypothetical protein
MDKHMWLVNMILKKKFSSIRTEGDANAEYVTVKQLFTVFHCTIYISPKYHD